MSQLDKVLYTAKAHTTGGRDGASRTDDGRLDITDLATGQEWPSLHRFVDEPDAGDLYEHAR